MVLYIEPTTVSGVALWQSALPLIRCRLGFYLSFIFLYTHYIMRVCVCVIFIFGEYINRFKYKVPLFQTERRSNGNHLPGKSTRTTGNPGRSWTCRRAKTKSSQNPKIQKTRTDLGRLVLRRKVS